MTKDQILQELKEAEEKLQTKLNQIEMEINTISVSDYISSRLDTFIEYHEKVKNLTNQINSL